LQIPKQIKTERVSGYLHHYSVKNNYECNSKAIYYARLSAENYFKAGKKANLVKLYVSPLFSFLRSYVLFFGFLDGKEGLDIAKITYKNKWLKYHYLQRMINNNRKKPYAKGSLAYVYSAE
jgi:hypothetical protein